MIEVCTQSCLQCCHWSVQHLKCRQTLHELCCFLLRRINSMCILCHCIFSVTLMQYKNQRQWYKWRWSLTINPANNHWLKDCHQKKGGTTAYIVIKYLQNVCTSLMWQRSIKWTTQSVSLKSWIAHVATNGYKCLKAYPRHQKQAKNEP